MFTDQRHSRRHRRTGHRRSARATSAASPPIRAVSGRENCSCRCAVPASMVMITWPRCRPGCRRLVLAEESWLHGHDLPESLTCIAVADTLRALGELAACLPAALRHSAGRHHRQQRQDHLPRRCWRRSWTQIGPGLKTAGNLNNLIGLPQMLFRLRAEHDWAVLEMGMSEPGEIDRLAEIAAPQVGVVPMPSRHTWRAWGASRTWPGPRGSCCCACRPAAAVGQCR